jgi:hypothetical protein
MSGYIGTAPVPQATQTRDSFTATSGQTSFATSGYTPNFLDVFLNGVKLAAADYTASNGSDVVLASGAATGDILEVVAYTAFDTANVTGATNFTVTGAFTSQGIDDNGNATALTIDSSENIMIGTTSQFGSAITCIDAGDSKNGLAINQDHAGGGFTPVLIDRTASDGTLIAFDRNGTSVGSIGSKSGSLLIGSTDTYLRVNDPSDTIFPSNSSGAERDNTINLGKGSSRFKDLYLSGGVYLGGTGADNHLDDYEEGTWSPFWCNNAGQAVFSVNPNVNMARYIKIGRQVTASCYFNMPGSFSPSGNFVASAGLQIGGLPFTANSNGTNDYYSGTVGWYANFASSYNNVSSKTPIIYTKTNSNQIELGHANGIGHASTLQEHAYNSNSGILLTISYLTTS